MNDRERPPPFTLPPHANAVVHKYVMEWLAQATPEQKFQTLVDAGILTPEGEFTEHYRTDSDEPSASHQGTEQPERDEPGT